MEVGVVDSGVIVWPALAEKFVGGGPSSGREVGRGVCDCGIILCALIVIPEEAAVSAGFDVLGGRYSCQYAFFLVQIWVVLIYGS